MTPEVQQAIDEIKATFTDASVESKSDGDGGAFITVDPVELSDAYDQSSTWMGVHITMNYPNSDTNPHFVRPDLSRKDEKDVASNVTKGDFQGRQAFQISRSSPRRNPEHETAAIKMLKVMKWLNGL